MDVMASAVESTLELLPSLGPLRAVRLGFDRVAKLSADAGRRIVDARAATRFISPGDLTRRAALNAHELQCLAQADALRALTGHRHQAAWAVAGVDTRPTPMLRESRVDELAVELPALAEAEETLADYRAHGRTLNGHPLALLSEQPAPFRIQPAAVLRGYPNGRLGRASGLVTHRQRPESAKATMFVTSRRRHGYRSTRSSGPLWPIRSASRCWRLGCCPCSAAGSARKGRKASGRDEGDRPLQSAAGVGQPQSRFQMSSGWRARAGTTSQHLAGASERRGDASPLPSPGGATNARLRNDNCHALSRRSPCPSSPTLFTHGLPLALC